MIDYAVVIASRQRLWWLKKQLRVVIPQLGSGQLIIVIDDDEIDSELMSILNNEKSGRLTTLIHLHYDRPEFPFGRINMARNCGAAMARPGSAIIEVDDHDLLLKDCLPKICKALENGADYVFGDCDMQAVIDCGEGRLALATWPSIHHTYSQGGFARGDLGANPIGVRGISAKAWKESGGWNASVWPGGDMDLAKRVEAIGQVIHIPESLCKVTVEPDSLSAVYRPKSALTDIPETATIADKPESTGEPPTEAVHGDHYPR